MNEFCGNNLENWVLVRFFQRHKALEHLNKQGSSIQMHSTSINDIYKLLVMELRNNITKNIRLAQILLILCLTEQERYEIMYFIYVNLC